MAKRSGPLKPLDAPSFDFWHAWHLLNRAGYGGTPSQVRGLANLGLDGAVDHILEFEGVPYRAVDPNAFDSEIMRPASSEERKELRAARQQGNEARLEEARRERQRRQRSDRAQMREFQTWWMRRIIETPRPLEEKMTLFWHGHFATGYRAIEDSYHMFAQNQMFRTNAVGNFRELTHKVVHDPAMLRYLNNNRNNRRKPNENLARELLELFTLGEGNGYTEDDIKEGARALTGYTFRDDAFLFARRLHDDGVKRIFGQSGNFDGDDLVDLIFAQKFASEYICLKLYRFFVNDLPGGPSDEATKFLRAWSRAFRKSNFDIRSALSILFRSAHFYDATNVMAQIKSPVQLIVQTLRSLRTPARSLPAMVSAAELMGQNLGFPPSVKGWDGGRTWINTGTLFVRQNLIVYLLTGPRPERFEWETDGATFDATHLLDHLDADLADIAPADAIGHLAGFMLGPNPHEDRLASLQSYVDSHGGRLNNDTLIGLIALLGAMPEYQLC